MKQSHDNTTKAIAYKGGERRNVWTVQDTKFKKSYDAGKERGFHPRART